MTQASSIDTGIYRRIVVLTGAGVSVASGLRPYRGKDGLWEEGDTQKYSRGDTMESEPDEVWEFFARARRAARNARPNAAHRALAEFEASLQQDQTVTILTQNIDGLHQRAGSHEVVELHGSLAAVRCRADGCGFELARDVVERTGLDCPRCPLCNDHLRPGVVLFGEEFPVSVEWAAKQALRECDLFLAIGTSGTVSPASNFVRSAQFAGARTVVINTEPMLPPNPYFQTELLGKAEELLPRFLMPRGESS